jgi:hypothetical protein
VSPLHRQAGKMPFSWGGGGYRISTLFFSILAAEKSGCVKYADFFFFGGFDLGFILVYLRIQYVFSIFYCNFVT